MSRKSILAKLAKRHKDSVDFQVYESDVTVPPGKVIRTGFDQLDWLFDIGGLPLGRMVMYYGPPGCGKTTMALENARAFQECGGIVIFIDNEAKLDIGRARHLGVDLGAMLHLMPESIEDGFQELDETVKAIREDSKDIPILVIYDSVNDATSKEMAGKDYDAKSVGREALVFSNKLPKLTRMMNLHDVTMIAIGQMRVNMDGFKVTDKFGVGNTWPHKLSSIMKWTSRGRTPSAADQGDLPDYRTVTIRNMKQQFGKEAREAEMRMYLVDGYDPYHSTITLLKEEGHITNSGAWYAFDGENFCQGKKNLVASLQKDDELYAKMKERVHSLMCSGGQVVEYVEPEEE